MNYEKKDNEWDGCSNRNFFFIFINICCYWKEKWRTCKNHTIQRVFWKKKINKREKRLFMLSGSMVERNKGKKKQEYSDKLLFLWCLQESTRERKLFKKAQYGQPDRDTQQLLCVLACSTYLASSGKKGDLLVSVNLRTYFVKREERKEFRKKKKESDIFEFFKHRIKKVRNSLFLLVGAFLPRTHTYTHTHTHTHTHTKDRIKCRSPLRWSKCAGKRERGAEKTTTKEKKLDISCLPLPCLYVLYRFLSFFFLNSFLRCYEDFKKAS